MSWSVTRRLNWPSPPFTDAALFQRVARVEGKSRQPEPECLVNRNADCFDAPGWTIFALCPRTMYRGGEEERERATVKPGEEDAAALVQEKGRKKKDGN